MDLTVKGIFDKYIEHWNKNKKYYLVVAKVEKVNDFTFSAKADNLIFDVNFATVETAENSFYIEPKVGSLALIGYTNNTDAYCLQVEKAEKIHIKSSELIFNNGTFGGLIKVEKLTQKLNELINEIRTMKLQINTHTHAGVMAGGSVTATPTPNTATFSNFNKSDYENDKIKH